MLSFVESSLIDSTLQKMGNEIAYVCISMAFTGILSGDALVYTWTLRTFPGSVADLAPAEGLHMDCGRRIVIIVRRTALSVLQ